MLLFHSDDINKFYLNNSNFNKLLKFQWVKLLMIRSTDPPSTENHRVTKAAGIVGSATLLSRIFGFIRDVVIAWFFGAGLVSDAFFVAFRIPNLLRRLLPKVL